MNNKNAFFLGAAVLLGVTRLAFAQIDGPTPPDGPMQGLMHRGRMADRLLEGFDTNRDGKITHAEFNSVLGGEFAAATHGAKQMTSDEFLVIHQVDFAKHTAEMFRRADWNGDGRLTLEEFAAPQRAHFEMMDQDGTGTVLCNPASNANLRGGVASYGVRKSTDNVDRRAGRGFAGFGRARFCADADLSRDGKVTRSEFDSITAREFVRASGGAATISIAQFSADQTARFHDLNAKMFKRLDVDGDGKLSLSEFAASSEKLSDRLDKKRDGVITPDEMKPQFRGPFADNSAPGGRDRRPGSRRY
jgi:Ca2+-binding EF-hand superfamily protein